MYFLAASICDVSDCNQFLQHSHSQTFKTEKVSHDMLETHAHTMITLHLWRYLMHFTYNSCIFHNQ